MPADQRLQRIGLITGDERGIGAEAPNVVLIGPGEILKSVRAQFSQPRPEPHMIRRRKPISPANTLCHEMRKLGEKDQVGCGL